MSRDLPVSIIIPIYNIEAELLTRCVASVANQTYDDIEIILVDDGSDNDTAMLTDRLAKEYGDHAAKEGRGSIRVIHKENGGSSSARNAGLRIATGEYIGFVDSDDHIDSDFVELMMDAVDRYDVPMVQISRDETDADGNRLPDVCIPPKDEKIITAEEQMRELLLHRGDCSFCTRLTKRALFNDCEFPEGMLNEDFHLLIRMLDKIERYVILPRQAYHVCYRIGSNSRSGDRDVFRQVYADIVYNADLAEQIVASSYPGLIKEAKRFALFQRLDYLLHVPIGMMNKDNRLYVDVVRYLRSNFASVLTNRYLKTKERIYLVILGIAPAMTRKLHRKIRG